LRPAAGTAAARQFSYWLHFAEGSAMTPLLFKLVFGRILESPLPFFAKPIARGIVDKVMASFIEPSLQLHLDFMESALQHAPWFCGEAFSAADIMLSRDGGANLIDSRVAVALVSGSTWRISGLAGLTGADGAYTLAVNAAGVTDATGTAGIGSGAVTWVKDGAAPTVQTVEQIATTPRNIVVPSVTVTFSEAIDPATFTRADLAITRNGTPLTLDERVKVEQVSPAVFKISGFTWFIGQEGTYVLSITAAGVADLAGNAGTGSGSTTWVMDTTVPAAPTNLTIVPDTGTSATDGLTKSKTVTLSGTLAETGLSVRLVDLVTNTDLGYADVTGTQFAKQITVTADGQNRIQIRVVDAAGNVNMASRLLQPGGYFDVFYDGIAPLVTGVGPVSPATRTTAVPSVDVTFSELIDPATFTWQDVSLTLDGGSNLATSGITIAAVAGLPNTYRISGLSGLTTADGAYRLAVNGAGIADPAGNGGSNSRAVEWLMNGGGTVRLSTLTGRVFHDYDGNGSFDESDLPLAGWTAFLDANGNGVYDSGDDARVTDAAGRYAFSSLAAGNYRVGILPPDGWSRSLPSVAGGIYLASVATGATTDNLDFGFYRAGEIRGLLFNDANSNGVRDLGEAGLAGWTVYLDDDGNGIFDSGEPSTTTAADGSYVFTGLAPATYAVATVGRTGWRQTSPGLGGGASAQTAAAAVAVGTQSWQSLVVFDQRCPCVAGTPTSFATALPTSADGSRFAWVDADPTTPGVIDIRYDFRGQTGFDNLISATQVALVERAFGLWEAASGGVLRFVRDTAAPAGDIINVGVGDLAALGGTSAARGVLGLGGAVFAPVTAGGLLSGVAWLDMAENWELNFGNGNVAGTFDFFSVAAHEIGHALGLEHLDAMPTSDLMDGIYGGERTTFTVADSTSVRSLYLNSGASEAGTDGTPGQWVILANVLPGAHVVKIYSGTGVTTLDFGNAQALTPEVSATGSPTARSTVYGTASAATTMTVSGVHLASDLVVTAPAGFEVSSDGISYGRRATFAAISGSASGTLSVRLAAATGAGTYSGDITITTAGGAAVTVAMPESTVARKSVTVVADAQSKTYGDADPRLTYAVSGLVGGDTLTGALARTAGRDVGAYAIGLGTLGGGANYDVSFTGATLTITRRAVTITGISAVSRAYDGTTAATLSGAPAYANLADGDTFAVAGSPTVTFADKNVGQAKAVTVGGYTAPSANYTLAQPAGLTANITPKSLTVTANDAARVYGTNNPSLAATVSGFVAGESAASLITGNALVTTAATRASGVGTYPVTASVGTLAVVGGNYALVTFAAGTLTVSQAQVTFKADDVTKVFGQSDPTLTFSAFGLLGGDTPATALSGAPARATGEGVGTYTIGRGTLALTGSAAVNYSLVFTPGTFTIQAAPRLFVTGAFAKGSAWTTDYLGLSPFTTSGAGTQLGIRLADGAGQVADAASLTWNNVNRISVRFNQPIAAPAANSLTLLAVTGATNTGGRGTQSVITSTAVTMSDNNTVATWTVPTLVSGRYSLQLQPAAITSLADGTQLDGEWTTSSTTFAAGSGNGTAGGAFEFRFNVLVGDILPTGTVTTDDVNAVKAAAFAALSASNFRYDINGSGTINSTDGSQAGTEVGRTELTKLGSYAPQPIAAVNATVDGPFSITFPDSAAWRSAITAIRIGSTTLDASAYDRGTAGRITFNPAASILLQSAGTKSITISAPGYADVTVSQVIAAGAATKLAVVTQPVGPATNGGVLTSQPVVRIQDRYGNTVSSTATVTAQVETGTGSWSLGGTTSIAAVAGTATFANLTATRLAAGTISGARIRFTCGSLTLVVSNTFTIL